MKRTIETKIILGICALILVLPFVAADSFELWCLKSGETVNLGALCNPAMEIKHGPTILCMHLLDNGKICPAILNVCNGMGLTCSNSTTSNTTIDTVPPVLQMSSPTNGSVHTSRNVLIELSVSEKATLSYQKASDPRRWTNLCEDCTRYSKERSFDEGPNEITIRAVDRAHNEAYYTVLFNVDSKDPKIKSFSPSEGFASGAFQIIFTENNPDALTLHYGNYETGFRERGFNLATECAPSGSDTICATTVNVSDYDGQQIEAYVVLLDAAGNTIETKHSQLDIDYSDPLILNFSHVTDGKKVTFRLEIDEAYFSKVTYIDTSESNPKEKMLCSKLVNNVCEKQVNFNGEGVHNIQIIVRDLAGNEAIKNFTFSSDSGKPKIKEISPISGFASGLFEITFEEQNPASVILEYGNIQTGLRLKQINLTKCNRAGEQYSCSESINLEDYDGQEISYKFNVTDLSGQMEEKSQSGLSVDISFPLIKSLNYTINGKDVYFSIEVEEQYLKEISFIDNLDPRPREKKLCNKLVNGFCEKKASFRIDGNHDVVFKITDLADHMTAQTITFFTDSQKPKITMVSPEQKFISGLFEVEFKEKNPTSLILEYGNSALGFETRELSLEDDCSSSVDEYYCSKEANLSKYEGYEISYEFTLTDKVSQTTSAGATELLVDTNFPEFNSLTYKLIGNKKANVVLDATEPNIEAITYANLDDAKPREKSFCSKLSAEGICEKKITVNPGINRIDFTIIDKAGNSAVQQLVIQN
jgi:hypothetical protein